MPKRADVLLQDQSLVLRGELDFCNVMSIYDKSIDLAKNCKEITIDFSALQSSNSSGLALIVEWINWAKKNHKHIQFVSLSQDLQEMAKASDLDSFIKI